MKNRKKIGAALITLCLPGLMAMITWAPAASGATTADTGSTVLTEEECTWYMLGAPTAVNMVADFENGVDGERIEYTGSDLTVSAILESNLNVYSSGNVNQGDASTNSECTFYAGKLRPIVTMSIGDAEFTAKYSSSSEVDAALSFTASASLPFSIDFAHACADKWTVANLDLQSGALSGQVIQIPTLADVTSPVTTNGGDRCQTTEIAAEVVIPAASEKPDAPGDTYVWEGPTLTTALSTSGS